MQGGNSWGGWGGGGHSPPNFWPTTLFGGFHTTLTNTDSDRKVASEVVLMVLMGSFMVMFDKTVIVQFKKIVEGGTFRVWGNDVHLLGFGLEML